MKNKSSILFVLLFWLTMFSCLGQELFFPPDTCSVAIFKNQVVKFKFPTENIISKRPCGDTIVIITPKNVIQYFHIMDQFDYDYPVVRDVIINSGSSTERLVLQSNNNMYGRLLGPLEIFIGKPRKEEKDDLLHISYSREKDWCNK